MIDKMGGWLNKKKAPEKPKDIPNPVQQQQSGILPEDNWENVQQNKINKLKALSPAALRLFHELQDPNLSRDEFFKKAEAYNETHYKQIPAEGMYTELDADNQSKETLPLSRSLRVKMFANGRVSFSVADFSESVEKAATIPKAGEHITLTKRTIQGGEASAVGVGQTISGLLKGNITVGENIILDNGSQTSPVRSIRNENGKLVIETNTSIYEVK